MRYALVFCLILCALFCVSCSGSLTLGDTRWGQAEVFDDDRIPGAWCQASAVSYFDGWIYVASDSEVPDGSSLFRYRKKELEKQTAPQWVRDPLLDNLKKIEDSTVTPDGKYIFFVTAFDRFKPADPEYDWYNALVCMNRDGQTMLAMPSENPERNGSLALRNSIGRALAEARFGGVPDYFKVEGLAALPGRRLLFGIREIGHSWQNFSYVATILEARWSIDNGRFEISDVRVAYTFDTAHKKGIPGGLGISSLEYDRYHNRLLIVTSSEDDGQDMHTGSWLWSVDLDRFADKDRPQPLRLEQNSLLMLGHKAEGLALPDRNTLVLVFDDDRRNQRPVEGGVLSGVTVPAGSFMWMMFNWEKKGFLF